MPWQDAPIVEAGGGSWRDAPVVDEWKPPLKNPDQPVPHAPLPKPSAMARIGRGATDVTDRLAQLWIAANESMGRTGYPKGLGDIATGQMNEERDRYEKGRGPDAGFDVARAAGSAGMQAPMMLIPGGKTFMGRLAAGAGTGAASGALTYDPTNTFKGSVKNIGTGAVLGAVIAPAVGAIADRAAPAMASLVGKVKGAVERLRGNATPQAILQAVPEIASLAPEQQQDLIREAQKMVTSSGNLNTEQLGRKANLLANDVTPTQAMVTRDPALWTAERNLQKLAQSPDKAMSDIGNQLTEVYQGNDAALAGKLTGMSAGLPKGSAEAQGMRVMSVLDELDKEGTGAYGKLYEQIRAAKGGDLASDAQNLVSTLDDLKDNTYAEKLVSSVQNKLRRFGMVDADGQLTSNTLTLNQAEELRKFVNKLPNDFGKRDIIRAIDADVISGAGEDAFATARAAVAAHKTNMDNPAVQRALNTWGELQQGKTAQSFIKTNVIDAPAQDVKALLATVGTATGKDDATAALRAGVLGHLEDAAIDRASGQVSGIKLFRAMDKIGDEKLGMVLGQDGLAKLKSFVRASLDATTAPPYSAVNNSNTAPMLLALGRGSRYAQATPLLGASLQQVGKIAEQNAAQKQVAEALAAQATRRLPQIPGSDKLTQALVAASAPSVNSALNQTRQKTKPKKEK
jgi:hypothetical protein